ncbi:MAG: hypothetical protein IT270_21550 [Saprospiraceae bacterium]|nr:hypothetical protein [Saprospiraceae bacterium]MCC6414251.1 hypothetical protein [Saprospiraceae bacterium]
MKKVLLFSILALIVLPFVPVSSQTPVENSGPVEVSPSVLKTAEWAGFDYKGTLDKALAGEPIAIQNFIKFHAVVDGSEGIKHGVTCLELIPIVGDQAFAIASLNVNPKLHKLLLDRLMLAQGRTKKEALRQSMTNWAPLTWSVINGKGFPVYEVEGQVPPDVQQKMLEAEKLRETNEIKKD